MAEIQEEIKQVLEQDSSIDQDDLIERIGAPDGKILSELRDLMRRGLVSYDREYDIW